MVLSGLLNKRTVHEINMAGGSAIGLSGKDDWLLRCTQLDPALGLVGNPEAVSNVALGVAARRPDLSKSFFPRALVKVNVDMIENLLDQNLVPVIAPIGVGMDASDPNTYNVRTTEFLYFRERDVTYFWWTGKCGCGRLCRCQAAASEPPPSFDRHQRSARQGETLDSEPRQCISENPYC